MSTWQTWRKSTYSDGEGGSCVEVGLREATVRAAWRKSAHSDGAGGSCLEISDALPGTVPIRDSKTAPAGPALAVPAGAWSLFVAAVKADAWARGAGAVRTP
ncbi:DUF397 domain-containing protein [Streptomyces sp. NPDC001262]|uniref:DUF397 domain-containing protein n=1 Tax=unclassified Streptomyces TaxID=2593676 RepID=UPI00300FA129